MDWLQPLRTAKHLAATAVRRTTEEIRELADSVHARLVPFEWDNDRFASCAAGRQLPTPANFAPNQPVRRIIWGVWSGDNPMTQNRLRGWTSVQAHNPDIECFLVTPETLDSIVDPRFPIHPAYPLLSFVHRSDYLRCYLMHVHGGGYTDIKPTTTSWQPFFERLDNSGAWALGYPERGIQWIADHRRPLGDLPRRYHHLLIADGAFIMRPQTPLTALWFDEVHRKLTYWQDDLERAQRDPSQYPIRWTGLLGDINGGILLRYHKHLLQEPGIRPVMKNYR